MFFPMTQVAAVFDCTAAELWLLRRQLQDSASAVAESQLHRREQARWGETQGFALLTEARKLQQDRHLPHFGGRSGEDGDASGAASNSRNIQPLS